MIFFSQIEVWKFPAGELTNKAEQLTIISIVIFPSDEFSRIRLDKGQNRRMN